MKFKLSFVWLICILSQNVWGEAGILRLTFPGSSQFLKIEKYNESRTIFNCETPEAECKLLWNTTISDIKDLPKHRENYLKEISLLVGGITGAALGLPNAVLFYRLERLIRPAMAVKNAVGIYLQTFLPYFVFMGAVGAVEDWRQGNDLPLLKVQAIRSTFLNPVILSNQSGEVVIDDISYPEYMNLVELAVSALQDRYFRRFPKLKAPVYIGGALMNPVQP